MNEMRESVAPRGVTDPADIESTPEFPSPSIVPVEAVEGASMPEDERQALLPVSNNNDEAVIDRFHHGETPEPSDNSLITADPAREAALIAADLNCGKEALLRACHRLSNAWDLLKDEAAKKRLISELIDQAVIGSSDQRHGLDKSTVCALILGRAGILDRLSTGYSVLYASALLVDAMSGADEERAAEMIELFSGVKGGITRDFLERELMKRTSKPIIEQATAPNYDFGDGVDLLVMTPGESDWARIRSDHASADMLTRGLRLDQMGVVEAVMIVAPLREIPAAIKLLGCCGFVKMSHVLLTQSPPFADVIDATERAASFWSVSL